MNHNEIDTRIKIFRSMLRIRMVEEELADRYSQGLMRCPMHLSIGQEGVPAAVSECLRFDDYAVSTHRGHAHYLAKGGDLKRMLAEIYGKVTGCSKGRGGSMHLIDTSVGFMGTSAIVGNSIPIGVGFGLASSLKGKDQVSCIFLGDGATEEGAYYESINFAAVRKLPVLFLCENNFYSVYSPLSVRQPKGRSIAKVAQAVGLNALAGDGNDAYAVWQTIKNATDEIRSGSGPWLLEFEVYRWREHCGPDFDNHIGYRSQDEFELWKSRDPLTRMRSELSALGVEIDAIELELLSELRVEVEEAFAFAESSPFPERDEAFVGEYA
jgi:TPP-dependent pyruvate/acetoin dehydrogenase alpha subunit